MSSRRALVTGGAGFLGSALVRRLVAQGWRVRILDDESRGRFQRLTDLTERIETVAGDVRDSATVGAACADVEAVFHFAAVNGTEFFYTKPEVVLEVGVGGMLNVVHACVAAGVRELYVASSSEVYQMPAQVPTDERVPLTVPDPLNPRYSYAGSKIVSELLAINFGRRHIPRVVVFRPHNVYGPDMGREHVIPQLVLRLRELCAGTTGVIRLPVQGTGAETRAFVYVDDFVEGVLTVMAKGEHLGIYNIGTDEEITIAALASEIGRCYGRDVVVLPGDRPVGATLRRCPDVSSLRALGYEPRIPLREGLARTVRWYDAQPRPGERENVSA